MTLPSSGPISIAQVAAEYGLPANTPFPSGFYGRPGFPGSGAFSLSQCYGLSNVNFSPDGGNVAGSAVGSATATVTCNLPAVWTYTGGGTGGSVDVASGGTATSITFTVVAPGAPDVTRTWSLTGVSNGVTRNFSVSVTAFGSNPGT